MSTFKLNITDRLATLTLDRGRSNPINHQMIKDLVKCVQDLDADTNVGGLIITGKTGFFSSGIDLIEAYDYNKEEIKQFWIDFFC